MGREMASPSGGLTKLAVLAVGGNVLAPPRGPLTWEGQVSAAKEIAGCLLALGARGYRTVLTHGNGPQVGAILLQNERGAEDVPPNPLDVCVAQSQAQVGYALQLALQEELMKGAQEAAILPVVTLVVVDPQDPAFQDPTKPIGHLYPEERARTLQAQGWRMAPDARGGYRRVVPSPAPQAVVGLGVFRRMLEREGAILIAAGGGGIPVVPGPRGWRGVEAVVDKDLTSSVLARELGAELLVMVTDVPYAYADYGSKSERPLTRLTADEAERHLRDGQFPPGSMGPKVQAAVDFLRAGGRRAVITDVAHAREGVEGEAGTRLLP